MCHFNATSHKSTTRRIPCRLPNTNGDDDDDNILLQLRALNYLLERKEIQPNADIEDLGDNENKTRCLVLSAKHGLLKVVELLLEHGANEHAQNDYALRMASQYGRWNVVKLLKHGTTFGNRKN